MNERRTTVEIIAPTIDEAVEKGLQELGLNRDQVEIDVLDEGGRGLFGLISRQARVRLTIKAVEPSIKGETTSEAGLSTPPEAAYSEDLQDELAEIGEEVSSSRPPVLGEDFILDIARDVVQELLAKMKVQAKVTAEFGKAEDERSRVPVKVNVYGDDLSYLIGRQAETLNALQYIAALIVSKEVGHSIPLIVDIEGYRSRREMQLRQMARRLADQAIKTGKRQILEPMPANERRIIHIELRDHPQVTSESIGEEPRRKVTIIPKETSPSRSRRFPMVAPWEGVVFQRLHC